MTNSEFYKLLKQGLEAINAPDEAKEMLEQLRKAGGNKKPAITPKGAALLDYMMQNPTDLYTAQTIGVALQLNSRSVSGSMRALVNLGLVEKLGQNPTVYKLIDDFEETRKMYEAEDLDN